VLHKKGRNRLSKKPILMVEKKKKRKKELRLSALPHNVGEKSLNNQYYTY
jgi:hypothetical protein